MSKVQNDRNQAEHWEGKGIQNHQLGENNSGTKAGRRHEPPLQPQHGGLLDCSPFHQALQEKFHDVGRVEEKPKDSP